MKDYGRRDVALAAALSGVAGYVDAIGFLKLSGFFVSFMSGNSTRLGVGLATGHVGAALTALTLVGLFVAGVVLGALLARRSDDERRVTVMALVAALLACSAALIMAGLDGLSVAAMVLAMGAENSFPMAASISTSLPTIRRSSWKVPTRPISPALCPSLPASE